jgi:hypothetical protein
LRSRVQKLLSRIVFSPRSARASSSARQECQVRVPLTYGSHAEVRLNAPGLRWHGIADLLLLSPDTCEIRDFKTGAKKETHRLQLRIYALLWVRDTELNPENRSATKLIVSYDDGDLEIPAPATMELESLELEIRERMQTALAAINVNPPPVRPSDEACSLCSVRHLCSEYWEWQTTTPLPAANSPGQFADLELRITQRHGPTSWDGTVRSSRLCPSGTKVLLHASASRFDIAPSQILRLLNVYVTHTSNNSVESETAQIVATLGRSSEAFVMPV